ncbi:MAG TPA: FGGY family carbohydrate kinase [Thermoanaerobaculia bacterium]|jgi:glycerol kinase|nr:FGGY family carbohydrate kinase [Thermoanaerobaculia bacterium]
MLIAAIDQGSSSTKGALLDERGAVRARAEAPVGLRREGDTASHDAEELLASVAQVLVELSRAGAADAVALACQRSTCLLWERDGGRPLTRALSWQDLSATERVAGLQPHAAEIAARTGLRLSPYYAGGKLGLLLDATRGARAGAERGEVVAGTLDAFLVHRLTGQASTEPGHAGRTLLYALDEGRWDEGLAGRFGIPLAALPELLPSAGPRGSVRRGALADGALAGVPLLALLGDQQAALVGNGGSGAAAGDERVAVAHFGTGAFTLVEVGEAPRRHEGLLAAVAWSQAASRRFQLEGSVNSAGSAVDWALRLVGAGVDLLAEVGGGELDPERLPAFLPAFVGLGAPWWRPAPGALLGGISFATGGRELLATVLAGVAQRLCDCLEAFAAAGMAPAVVRASGRLASLPGLAGLLADLSGLSVEVVAEEEAGVRGAARLAALAAAALPAAALGATPPLRLRRAPHWDAARRLRVRRSWGDFVAAAGAAAAGSTGPKPLM